MTLSVSLRKRYARPDGEFSLDLNFDAPPGVTVLFGPSGAGKSTTLDCIAGIARPDSGRIALDETVFFEAPEGDRPRVELPMRDRRVGYVFQRLGLFEHLTVRANLAYGLADRARDERTALIDDILNRFGIAHTADRRPRTLSGGERQRVALARTLVVAPRALLLDEPFTALDAKTKSGLLAELAGLKERRMIPIIYVTHDEAEVTALADRVVTFSS